MEVVGDVERVLCVVIWREVGNETMAMSKICIVVWENTV